MKKYYGCLANLKFDPIESLGRRNIKSDEDSSFAELMDPFSMDEDQKLRLSKAYRRLEGKTQVFYAPDSPYVRTRMTHTGEVVSLASIIAGILGLNTPLCRAIALLHDLGHVPFGHLGERFLSEKLGTKFRHSVFSLIVSEMIERRGVGLNLCFETLEGAYHHSGGLDNLDENLPQEYAVAKIADKVGYTLSDFNDACHMGYIEGRTLSFDYLGKNQRERTRNIVRALLKESKAKGKVSFGESEESKLFKEAREYMFTHVYSKADEEIDFTVLENGYKFIETTPFLNTCQPAIIFALLTEKEVKFFADLYKKGRYHPREIEQTGVTNILPKEDIPIESFSSFPFKKEEFSKEKSAFH